MSRRDNDADAPQPPSKQHRRSTIDDDKVGYGKPPRAYQFKPGQSGNPRGRPKGTKNESTMLEELLHRKVQIREGGRERKITVLEAMLRRFAEDSLKGNTKSAAFLLNRYAAMETTDRAHSELSDDDQAVLKAYAQKLVPESGPEKDPP